MRVRCKAGHLTSEKTPCKVCGSTWHLIHCHCFDDVSRNAIDDVEGRHWMTCPHVHRHVYEASDYPHSHEGVTFL